MVVCLTLFVRLILLAEEEGTVPLEKSKFENSNLLIQLNTKYLIGITGFLYETYKYNKQEFKKAYINFLNNRFKIMEQKIKKNLFNEE